jgi:hypothetical protein
MEADAFAGYAVFYRSLSSEHDEFLSSIVKE